MNKPVEYPERNEYPFIQQIAQSKKSIYDPIEIGDPNLWIPTEVLEKLLCK